MRLPSLQSLGAIFSWWPQVIRRYEQDYDALAGASTIGVVAAGTTQDDAVPLSGTLNVIATAPASSGVMLPPQGQVVQQLMIVNKGSHTLKVYPQVDGQINALGANVAFSLAAGKILVGYYSTAIQFDGGLLS